MPETHTPTTDPATPAAAAPTNPEPGQEPDWKTEARKWEQRAKQNKAELDAAAPRLSEYDRLVAASKTDQQRLEEDAAKAREEAASARTEALRFRIALKHGIAEEDFDFLGTGTEQELDERAARLAAKNLAAGQPAGPRPPAPNPAQGTSGSSSPTSAKDQFTALVRQQLAPH
jgi:hypothetical protein